MKLAAIYSVWDSEELLEQSIRQIREHVDLVIVVVSEKSNFGEPYNGGLLKTLNLSWEQKIIDQIIRFEPKLGLKPIQNEADKRREGLNFALSQNCTHYLYMDCDEYYHPEQFKAAKETIIANNYDSTACRLFTYYKEPVCQLEPMEEYYVPFIHKLTAETKTGQLKYPVYADPTRRHYPCKNFHAFKPDEIAMHHYSYVRKDIARKLNNSSAKRNFRDIGRLIEKFNNYKHGDTLINFEGFSIKEVPNYFNINI